jgi:hypothetical protein
MTYDVELIRQDGSVRNFRVYDQPPPKDGDIITLPVDGQLTKARVNVPPEKAETVQAVDAKAVEI